MQAKSFRYSNVDVFCYYFPEHCHSSLFDLAFKIHTVLFHAANASLGYLEILNLLNEFILNTQLKITFSIDSKTGIVLIFNMEGGNDETRTAERVD